MDRPKSRELQTTYVVLDPAQRAHAVPVTDTIWTDLDANFDNFRGHGLVASFSFTEDWPTWEMHPNGDEVVCLMAGSADMILRDTAGESRVTLDSPGAFVIVPRGVWHTARIDAAATMVFVTPGEGTENREQPPV